jgi:hypothetical protein
METLTDKEAFLAMYSFLEAYYERGKSDDIGALLSGLSLLTDGGTADPGFWKDWLEAIGKAKHGSVDARLILRQPEDRKNC